MRSPRPLPPRLDQIVADYSGQPVCARCGHDPDGRWWPNCVAFSGSKSDRRAIHEVTCAAYWATEEIYVCDDCEADMARAEREGLS